MKKYLGAAGAICAAVVAISLAQETHTSTTYYVSVSGDDAAAGTLEAPWRSIQRAVNAMQPGDTTLVRGGAYDKFVAIGADTGNDGRAAKSGTAELPITLRAYPGEEVVWRNDMSFPLNSPARYEMILIQRRNYWIIDGFRFEQTAGSPGASTWWGYGIWLEFANGTQIRNNIFDGNGTLRAGGVVVNLRRQSDGVIVENNTFLDWPSHSDLMGVMLESDWRDVPREEAIHTNHDTMIRNNRFEGLGGDCIQIGEFGGQNTLIENNTCWMKYNDALNRATEEFVDVKFSDRTIIRGNVAWGGRPKPTSPGGGAIVVHLGAKNVIVEDNIFYDNTRGIGLGVGSPSSFPEWFTGERAPQQIAIRRNLFFDIHYKRSWDGIEGTGTCIDASGIKGLQIYHNVFAHCAIIGIRLEENEAADIRNNIFYRSGRQHIWENSERPRSPVQLKMDYNIFDWSGSFSLRLPGDTFLRGDLGILRLQLGLCLRCRQADPLFVSPTTDPMTADYRLAPGSPAIDQADVLPGYNDAGFTGAAPDIGKCEAGSNARCGIKPIDPPPPLSRRRER